MRDFTEDERRDLANLVGAELDGLTEDEAELGGLLGEGRHLGRSDGRSREEDDGSYQDRLKTLYGDLTGHPYDED